MEKWGQLFLISSNAMNEILMKIWRNSASNEIDVYERHNVMYESKRLLT